VPVVAATSARHAQITTEAISRTFIGASSRRRLDAASSFSTLGGKLVSTTEPRGQACTPDRYMSSPVPSG
jgi:hypothetical protein